MIAILITESKTKTYTHWYQINFLSNLVPFISVYFFELWTWHNIQNDWHPNNNPLSSVSTHSVVCVNSKRSAYLESIFRFFSILTFTFDSVYTYLSEECRRARANRGSRPFDSSDIQKLIMLCRFDISHTVFISALFEPWLHSK